MSFRQPAPAAGPTCRALRHAQLAVGEQADFDRAKEALDSGSFRTAADLFATFAQTYTGGPLTGEAHYWRGRALSELGEPSEAARAYLESFSGSPEGTRAPDALLQLALKLAELDQPVDACATMGEVPMRFPGTEAALDFKFEGAEIEIGNPFRLQVLANVRFDGETPEVSGPDEIVQNLPFKVVDETAFSVVYKTTDVTP
ncbi:hypothetical protein LCGC14_2126500 [marine sediment metagenome]|uniref:Tetratricopeptide repeat protein n=1 Tax=marine sediment metagenome TaxID=412755 RepID=A0A0F9E2P3_9ZZZZ